MPIESKYISVLTRVQQTVNLRWPVCLLLIGLLLPLGPLIAQDAPGAIADAPTATAQCGTDSAVAQEGANVAPLAKPTVTPEQRRKIAVASLMMVGVIAVLLLLFVWMLWWSRRTWKLLREPLPAAGRGDELWYLKAKQDIQQATERLAAAEKDTHLPPNPDS